MGIIKIYTKDGDTIISATAAKDDGTAYSAGEVTAVRIFRIGPRNDTTVYPAVTASFTTYPAFEGIITGTLPTEGYWGFQFEYTLLSSTKPVHTKIFYEYVGPTINST